MQYRYPILLSGYLGWDPHSLWPNKNRHEVLFQGLCHAFCLWWLFTKSYAYPALTDHNICFLSNCQKIMESAHWCMSPYCLEYMDSSLPQSSILTGSMHCRLWRLRFLHIWQWSCVNDHPRLWQMTSTSPFLSISGGCLVTVLVLVFGCIILI